MKADRTIVVLGVFLFLIGFAVAWNGYGYIQIERGWSMVISGTIGFCSGLILIALGLLLRQLRILSASAAQSALFLAKARGDALSPHPLAPSAAMPLPAASEDEPAPIATQAPVRDMPETQDFGFEIERDLEALLPALENERSAPRPPAWMTRAGGYAASFAAAKVPDAPDLEETKPEADPLAWIEEAFAEQAATLKAPEEADVAETRPQSEFHEEMAPAALSEMTFSEIHVEEPAEVHAAIESAHEPFEQRAADLHEVEPSPEFETDFAHEAETPAHEEPAEEPEPETGHQPEPKPEAAQGPAIIGQYEAHGARYTMYADGSIDAETAHGVYHFDSMDELKRFIEQSN